MSYASYASRLSSKVNEINDNVSSITGVDINSCWNGKAHDKLSGNLSDDCDDITTSLSGVSTLCDALKKIDDYDAYTTQIERYESSRRNLNSEAENYSSQYSYYTGLINNAASQKESLKEEIKGLLSSIKVVSPSPHKKIDSNTVENTSGDIQTIDELKSKIGTGFDMSKTVVSKINFNPTPDFSNTGAWGASSNPYSASGLYGQCTWFAWGRFYEMYGYNPGFTGNGQDCARQLVNSHGDKFELSSTPKAGAVFSFTASSSHPYGHTGVVLSVNDDGTITIQDGNYNGRTDSFEVAQSDWGTRTGTVAELSAAYGGAEFANPI